MIIFENVTTAAIKNFKESLLTGLDSDKQCTPEKQKLCDDLNEIVDVEYRSKTHTPSKKRKREYRHYSPQQKAKIAR